MMMNSLWSRALLRTFALFCRHPVLPIDKWENTAMQVKFKYYKLVSPLPLPFFLFVKSVTRYFVDDPPFLSSRLLAGLFIPL